VLLFLGIDDTDAKVKVVRGSKLGTGRVARDVANELMRHGFKVLWVTRHQLMKSVTNTSGNNSAKAVTLEVSSTDDIRYVREVATRVVSELSLPSSNPGIAINPHKPPPKDAVELALRASSEPISLSDVLSAAKRHGIDTICIRSSCEGVIGAFSASVLAALGYGRVLDIPYTGLRNYMNKVLRVSEILKLGIHTVRDVNGHELNEYEYVYVGKFKPYLEDFKPVLYVVKDGALWRAVVLD